MSEEPIVFCADGEPYEVVGAGAPVPDIVGGHMVGTEHLNPPLGIPRTRRKVAIIGFAPSSMRDAAPLLEDPEFEIWPLNQLYVAWPGIGQHATRWFQLHNRSSYDQAVRDHKHSEWLAAWDRGPIYMQEEAPDIPMSVQYPLHDVCKTFGYYFTNSISWMIAIALYEHIKYGGLEALHIYGVDMAQSGGPGDVNSEYAQQRPSCEWLIGWAQALLGKEKVYIPAKSDLMKALWLYPFEDDQPFINKISGRIQELTGRMQQMRQQAAQLNSQADQLAGAVDNMHYVGENWRGIKNEMSVDTSHLKAGIKVEQ